MYFNNVSFISFQRKSVWLILSKIYITFWKDFTFAFSFAWCEWIFIVLWWLSRNYLSVPLVPLKTNNWSGVHCNWIGWKLSPVHLYNKLYSLHEVKRRHEEVTKFCSACGHGTQCSSGVFRFFRQWKFTRICQIMFFAFAVNFIITY